MNDMGACVRSLGVVDPSSVKVPGILGTQHEEIRVRTVKMHGKSTHRWPSSKSR